MALIYFLVILAGFGIGAFVNICIYAWPRGIPLSRTWTALTNTPKRKWVFKAILVGFLNALLYLGVYLKYGLAGEILGYYAMTSVLLIIFFIDFEFMLIPDEAIVLLLAAGVLLLFNPEPIWIDKLLGLFSVSVPFLIIALATKGQAMGGGDIKLMAAIGFCLGWKLALVSLMTGIFGGAIIILLKLLFKKDFNLKSKIALGPYLALGSLVAIFGGQELWAGYFKLFL